MLKQSLKLALAAIAMLLAGHLTASHATFTPGSESPDMFLYKLMVRSDDGKDCVIYFLQERSLSSDDRCVETNHAIKYLFAVKKLDIRSHVEIKRIEVEVLKFLLKVAYYNRW